jgi:glycosyltransferase involved in cell wall biosynthesis
MKISVIIPVRNEEDSISALLEALIHQSRRPDEIVITDGGSRDKTARIIEEYPGREVPVHLIRESAALPGRGRNLAAARASYEWLAFIDAGITPTSDWLRILEERARRDPSADVIYGSWEPVTDSFFKECAAIAYLQPHVLREGELMRHGSIASSLIRREVWQAVGGFPEHLRSAEDILFMERVERQNFHISYAPKARVHWNIQPTLSRTYRRFVVYSRHNLRAGLWRKWQAAIFRRYAFLLSLTVLVFVLSRWWMFIALGLWVAMLAARAAVAIRRNRRGFPAAKLRSLLRLLVIVPILAVLDAATIMGSIHWLMSDKFRLGRSVADLHHGT